MPIKIPRSLPAKEILEGENIFVMDEDRAVTQDIRPLKICILNLMPTKIVTETQLLRLLSTARRTPRRSIWRPSTKPSPTFGTINTTA